MANVEITTSLDNLKNVEITSKNFPDITFVFSDNKRYELKYLMDMKQTIHNNFTFKNIFTFTTVLVPLELLNELEKGSPVNKVIINEVMKNNKAEDFSRHLIIYSPEITVSREIDSTGDFALWTFKISYKTLY